MTPPATPSPATDGDERLGRLVGAIHVVSSLTLLSRIGGLVRDAVTARVFGDTVIGSAFAAAFTFPNLFRRLFGEGALSAAFLPEYTRAVDEDPAGAGRFASLTVALLIGATGAITLLLEVLFLLLLILTPVNHDRDLTFRLIMVLLPFMPLVCVGAVLGGMLQVHGRFAMPAAAPVILNVCMIAGGAWHFLVDTESQRTAFVISGCVLAAGVLQILWALHALRGRVAWTRVFTGAGARATRTARTFVPVLIGLGTLQLNALVDGLIAMWPVFVGPSVMGIDYPLDGRSYVILSYSSRLYQFPLGVFGIAVATAVFPLLARSVSDADGFVDTLRRGLRLSLFIGLPASLGLALVRIDLPAVMYAGGDGFSADGVRRASLVLLGYAPAVWAYSLNHVRTRAFYARGDTLTPMKIGVAMVGLNFVLNLVLIWPLGEAGLAWSTCISAIVQTWVLSRVLDRRLGQRVMDRSTWTALRRTIISTLGMGGVVWIAGVLMPDGSNWLGHLTRLIVMSLLGAVAYGLIAMAMRIEELQWLASRSEKPS